ncbi:hypothetical protein OAD19_00045 [Octadecabacter sp.]|nr:hypothetical protein [Octadecabacter sp.]
MIRQLVISLILAIGVPSIAAAASFDCDKAATETEIAICNDPKLSELDELLGELWASREREPYEVKLQANWLTKRNACEGNMTCIAFNYNTHLQTFIKNEPLKCFEQTTDVDGFVYFEQIDADLNGDGSLDKARFSMLRYDDEFEIRLNVFLDSDSCAPTFSWGDGIRNVGWASGFCSGFGSGYVCVDGSVSVNSSNNLIASIGYYGEGAHGGIPTTDGTYTISLSNDDPNIVGYDNWPRNITSGPSTMYSFNFLSDLVIESLVNDAISGGDTISERMVKHDFDPVSFPTGTNFEVPDTAREYWEDR